MSDRGELLWSMNHDDVWRLHAACSRGLDLWLLGLHGHVDFPLDLFFPEDGHKEQAARAKQVCAVCPVREDCLEYSLALFIRDGVWGGTTERQRRPMWRARRSEAS